MLDEIRRRLKDGKKIDLVCVYRVSFLASHFKEMNERILARESITVESISECRGVVFLEKIEGCTGFDSIDFNELKYFKIKGDTTACNKMGGSVTVITGDNRSKVAFNKLIDTVAKGAKDGVITVTHLDKDSVVIRDVVKDDQVISVYSHNHVAIIQSIIETIESLYVETFVIEDLESLRRVKIDAEGVLSNGVEFKVRRGSSDYFGESDLYIEFMDETTLHAPFEVLKGAKVTQTKGDE